MTYNYCVVEVKSGYKTKEEGREPEEPLTFWTLIDRVNWYYKSKEVAKVDFINEHVAYVTLRSEIEPKND
jgi:hypothetical protein